MRFTYHGVEMPGFLHLYNLTWFNERTVELAVAYAFLEGREGIGLEIGNVLGHYGPFTHSVVDRYEQAAWHQTQDVRNVDIFDVCGRWDWIVSISTIEHIRWDEPERDPRGAVAALAYLRRLLAPGGRALVSFPLGYHPGLDEIVVEGRTGAERSTTLVRASAEEWVETVEPQIIPYGSLDPWAASLFIGEFMA